MDLDKFRQPIPVSNPLPPPQGRVVFQITVIKNVTKSIRTNYLLNKGFLAFIYIKPSIKSCFILDSNKV